jgi:hypothetical protein
VTVSVQPQTAPPPTGPSCPPSCDPPPPTPGPSPTGPLAVRLSASAATLGTATVFAAAVEGAGGQNFAWDFGDGARVDGFSPTSAHTYAALGSYQATVIVRDTFGRVGSAGAISCSSLPFRQPCRRRRRHPVPPTRAAVRRDALGLGLADRRGAGDADGEGQHSSSARLRRRASSLRAAAAQHRRRTCRRPRRRRRRRARIRQPASSPRM